MGWGVKRETFRLNIDFPVIVQFDGSYIELSPLRMDAEVRALIIEHCDEKEAMIYTDVSVG